MSSTVARLSDLKGLETARRLIPKLVADRKTQAVLFYGAEGAGKNTLARLLTQCWLCANPTEEGACGECAACAAYERGNSIDVNVVFPRPPSNIIKIGLIKEIPKDTPEDAVPVLNFLRTPPIKGQHKIVIIQDADRMNGTAANSLLKTLEEPPPYAKFILITASISLLPITIVSRCLGIKCELPSEDSGGDEISARATDGAPGELKILSESKSWPRLQELVTLLESADLPQALAFSCEFESICDGIEKECALAPRLAQAEGLRRMGNLLTPEQKAKGWGEEIAQAHKRIQGNVRDIVEFDRLFTTLLRRD